MRGKLFALTLALALLPAAAAERRRPPEFDVIIRGGTVYDGTGGPARRADVALRGDCVAAVGDLSQAGARTVVDARGLAVAPGFINMLSWSNESLIADGRSQSEIRQGVTTEIMGEGTSMGPLSEEMKRRLVAGQGDIKYAVEWTTLAEYLKYLERRGVSPNVASFIGAGTIRRYVIGLEDRKPTPAQLEQMRALVRDEMEHGALGIGSSLIYAPDTYATTEELVEMSKVAAQYRGKYISHMRNEGDTIFEALEELFRISREAGIPAEVYHIKAGGEKNWPKMDRVLEMIEEARARGLRITADMYLYTASSNGLDARIPAWAHDGGPEKLYARLEDPATRKRIADEMRARGPVPRILLVKFKSEKLKPLTGRTLEEVARERGRDQVETALDLVLEDRSSVKVVTFSMSEENLKKELQRPWVSICSDAASMAPEGVFLKSSTHPRAYGNFARLLGKYVREERVITLEEAVRRLSGLPATNLGLDRRGFLKEGYFADVVVFDPATISDRATYEDPQQYAVGVRQVFVNGVQVIRDGEHTGAKPGRALWGPGRVK